MSRTMTRTHKEHWLKIIMPGIHQYGYTLYSIYCADKHIFAHRDASLYINIRIEELNIYVQIFHIDAYLTRRLPFTTTVQDIEKIAKVFYASL